MGLTQTDIEHINGTLRTVVIPEGVTAIQRALFWGAQDLTKVILPNTLQTIGDSSFRECAQLTQIHLPESITYIRDYAFQDTPLTSVDLPPNARLGAYCFSNTNIETLYIPSTIKTLSQFGGHRFEGCTKLKSVVWEAFLDEYDFADCTALETVNYQTADPYPAHLRIDNHVFSGCTSLKNFNTTLPIYGVGREAFQYTAIEHFEIKNTSTSTEAYIYYCAFRGCNALKSISIDASAITISESAFLECPNLLNIYCTCGEEDAPGAPWGAENATVHYNSTGPEDA